MLKFLATQAVAAEEEDVTVMVAEEDVAETEAVVAVEIETVTGVEIENMDVEVVLAGMIVAVLEEETAKDAIKIENLE